MCHASLIMHQFSRRSSWLVPKIPVAKDYVPPVSECRRHTKYEWPCAHSERHYPALTATTGVNPERSSQKDGR